MFGFILPNLESLDDAEQRRYRAVYCGVCRSIRRRYGQRCRLTVSYDMTFLALVLGSLYEPTEEQGAKRCPVHPTESQEFACSPYTDYAADLSVALAYHKLLDDWRDDRSKRARAAAAALAVPYRRARRRRPEACRAIERAMDDIHAIEQEALAFRAAQRAGAAGAPATVGFPSVCGMRADGPADADATADAAAVSVAAAAAPDAAAPTRTADAADAADPAPADAPAAPATTPAAQNSDRAPIEPPSPDAAANRFGLLMGDLFALQDDFWATDLRRFGARLGKFVYVMDAAVDLEEDQKSGSYNPFVMASSTREDAREGLELLAAGMVDAFERLPLERDVHVLRSVLYAGVWQQFESKESKDKDGDG